MIVTDADVGDRVAAIIKRVRDNAIPFVTEAGGDFPDQFSPVARRRSIQRKGDTRPKPLRFRAGRERF